MARQRNVVSSRNSSIELLRLATMLMIVSFHYVDFFHGLESQRFTFKKISFELIYACGWIGNFIFFAISIWFLLDRDNTVRSSLRRVWILERELLFWSITLLVAMLMFKLRGGYVGQVSMVNLAFHSAFPLSTALWWYPTSYALFLIFLPFLNAGMKQLAQRQHKQLAIICLVLWGFLGLIPKINFDLTDKSVFVFIYWYILLSYYRWHMKKISTRQCWIMLGIGAMTGAVWLLGTNLLFSLTGRMPQMQSFIFRHWRLPMMMMGFAIFLLVMRTEFHNRLINTLASSAFGIFLIHSYPPILLSWVHYNPLDKIYQGEFAFLHAMAVVLYVYVACLLLDLIRQALFRLTIDRRRGACFDRLYAWSVHRFGKRGEHLISVAGPSAGSKGDDSDLVD